MTQEMLCPDCGAQIPQEAFDGRPEYECAQCGARLDMSVDAPAPPELPSTPLVADDDAVPQGQGEQPQGEQQRQRRQQKCPDCGAPVSRNDRYCPACDYRLADDGDDYESDGRGYPIEIGNVFNQTWELFQEQGGLVVGVTLLAGFINGAATLPEVVLRNIAEQEREPALIVVAFAFQIIRMLFSIWISIGYHRFILNVVKGRKAEVTDLFSGMDLYGLAFLNSFVFGLAVVLGTIALIVPGIFLSLAMWPFLYVLIDHPESSGLEPLSRAWKVTEGNRASTFVLWLMAMGINILGMLVFCVGLLVTSPFTTLMFAVAYYHMTGREVGARSRRRYDDAYGDDDKEYDR
ncbi:MAG: hypothetical protein KDA66_04035 [Planctomycetaceae bacterium]|nr:hypothetical protein [Planctomycetaceae bacterium]